MAKGKGAKAKNSATPSEQVVRQARPGDLPTIEPTSSELAAQGFLKPFSEFTHNAAAGGLILLFCAIVALLWANSPWGEGYEHLVHEHFGLFFGNPKDAGGPLWNFDYPLHYWINDGLMAIFFFVVGLEIKREVLVGELSGFRKALLPIGAAFGGMIAPAAVFSFINWNNAEAMRGWAIPTATDIAFAVGVMALLGKRVPEGLKVFLVALAIADDLGAVLVIAIFYTEQIFWGYLWVGLFVFLLLAMSNYFGFRSALLYGVLTTCLWYCFLKSGIHATLAGVVAAMTVPTRVGLDPRHLPGQARALVERLEQQFAEKGIMGAGMVHTGQFKTLRELRDKTRDAKSPLQRFEHALHPWVTFGIVPIFALFNAGVILNREAIHAISSFDPRAIAPGVTLGLILGKQVGVFTASWLLVKTGVATLPSGVGWRELYGAAWLTGMGFTMSLFISGLAYKDVALHNEAKMGILLGSLIAGVIGFLFLYLYACPEPEEWEKQAAAKAAAEAAKAAEAAA
jgi:NhaA family Na+:H+ antiporter